MRTIVAGSVWRRLASARTLSSTYSRGCSRIGRMISCRLMLSCAMRRGSSVEIDCAVIFLLFMSREDCLIWAACQPSARVIASRSAEWRQALLFRCGRFGFQTGSNHRLKEGHHRTKFRAELLDGMRLLAMASSEEVGAALFVFFDPGLREAAVADFR